MSLSASLRHRVDSFDGLRAIAALGVYYCHAGNDVIVGPIVIRGHSGVHLFFVLSGYLLFSPFLKALAENGSLPDVGRFYLRRFLRIYPPYLVALVAYTLMRMRENLKPPDTTNLATHGLLIFNYFDRSKFFSINAAFWTLAIEAQFYLLLPVLAWLAWKLWGKTPASARNMAVATILIGIGSRAAEFVLGGGWADPEEVFFVRFRTVFGYLDLFGFGMLAAYADWRSGESFQRDRRSRIGMVGLGLLLYWAAHYWSYLIDAKGWQLDSDFAFTLTYPVLVCAGFGLIVLAAAVAPEENRGLLTWVPLVWIGKISYSMYLYHIGCEYVVARWDPGSRLTSAVYFRNLLNALIALPPTLIVSAVMYYLVEKPFLGVMSRFKSNPKPAPVTATV